MDAAEQLAEEGISVEVFDPRTLVPLDWDAILSSVARTGHLVVADPANRTCSAASEISGQVVEHCFDALRGPIVRVTTGHAVPFSPALEKQIYPNVEKIVAAARRALAKE